MGVEVVQPEFGAQDDRAGLPHRVLVSANGGYPTGAADTRVCGLHCHETRVGALKYFVTGILMCTIGTGLLQATGLAMVQWKNAAACATGRSA